ncbi:MAG: dynamin family protein [Pseudomonadota bacterium]
MNVKSHFASDSLTSVSASPDPIDAGLMPLQTFADRVEQTEIALAELEVLTGTTATRAVSRLSKELAEFEPSITFLGQVKSGKTTLVNAMAGWPDLLPSDVNPWTSVVTSLHLVPGGEKADISARFQLMQQEEWDRLMQKGGRLGEMANRAGSESELETIREQIETLREKSRRRLGRKFELLLGQEHEYGFFDKNLLERYICLGDDLYDEDADGVAANQGRFADITRSADLYLNSDRVPFRLCLRDTPGVNDTFMMREQVTINAVRTSRVCVVVLSAHQALTTVDMALIRMISSLQSRDVVIFVNRIDELRDPGAQVPEIEASIRQVLSDHKGPKDARIVFGSALWAHHVLAENIDQMNAQSSDALVKWAAVHLESSASPSPTDDDIWQLSGLRELNQVMSERVVEKIGDPMLRKITNSAISVASGQQAANKVKVEGEASASSMSMHEVKTELNSLATRHHNELAHQTEKVIKGYQSRADRAHDNFIERATHALITHLETNGDQKVWSYNPTGLRMLLRSAYSVFATRAQSSARAHYEAAVVDVAELYFRAFGKAVEGIELSVPEVQEFPAPVAIAQTLALDFNDSWWVSWWRRTRGYKAFAKQFHALVAAETEDFMTQLKTVQTAHIQAQLLETIDAFFAQNLDIMIEISTSRGTADGLQRLCISDAEQGRLEQIDDLIVTLKQNSGPTMWEGITQ